MPPPCPKKFKRIHCNLLGFTLIELMVVITIISIITGIGVASYNKYNSRRIVEKAAEELRANIRLAQSRAINNEKDSRCGPDILDGWYVEYLSSSSYQLFCICGGNEYRPSSAINITNVSLNSFSTFGFKPLIGNATLSQNITIIGDDKSARISVSTSGDVTITILAI